MFDVIDETQIREAGRHLSCAVPDGKGILFGSHARETPAIAPTSTSRHHAWVDNAGLEAVRVMRELRDLRLPLEVIVVSGSDVEDRGNVRGSFVHTAIIEGRILAG